MDRSGEWLAPVIPFPGAVAVVDASDVDVDAEHESDADAAVRAENISMHALTRRAMSVREMEKLLRTREIPGSIAASEVARLEGVGLLDDDALARDLVERLQRRKGLGVAALKAELVARKIRPSAIESAVAELPGEQIDLATAEARKRMSRLGALDRDTAYRRLQAYLARRGFRGHEISAALATVLPR